MNEFRNCLTKVHSIVGMHPTARSALLLKGQKLVESSRYFRVGAC